VGEVRPDPDWRYASIFQSTLPAVIRARMASTGTRFDDSRGAAELAGQVTWMHILLHELATEAGVKVSSTDAQRVLRSIVSQYNRDSAITATNDAERAAQLQRREQSYRTFIARNFGVAP